MECVDNVYNYQKLLRALEIDFVGLDKLDILSHSSILVIKPLITINHEDTPWAFNLCLRTLSMVSIASTKSPQIRIYRIIIVGLCIYYLYTATCNDTIRGRGIEQRTFNLVKVNNKINTAYII